MAYTEPNAIPYKSLAGTDAKPSGPPLRRYPLPDDSPIQLAAYAFDQQFEMLLSSFPPAAKNTPSNSGTTFGLTDGNAILTKYTQPSATGGGLGTFTASFARVPASWNDFQTMSCTFPGWLNTYLSGLARTAKAVNCTVRIRHDYYVINPAGGPSLTGVKDSAGSVDVTTVASKGLIPIIKKNVWLQELSGTAQTNAEVNDLVPSGGVTIGDLFWLETFPNVEQYRVWCGIAAGFTGIGGASEWTNAAPPIWDGTTTNITTAGQFVIEDSRLAEYEGNIVDRVTTYALFR